MNPVLSFFAEVVFSNAIVCLLLAICVFAFGRFCKRPAFVHFLWVLVVLKLFTPPLLLLPTPDHSSIESTVGRTVGGSYFQNATGLAPLLSPTASPTAVEETLTSKNAPSLLAVQASSIDRPAFSLATITWLLMVIWLIGSLAMLVLRGRQIWQFRAALKRLPSASDATTKMVANLASRLDIQRPPEVLLTRATLPPLVWAIGGRPKIVLPKTLFKTLSPSSQQTIIGHELVHIQRRDHWVRLLELAATTFFWWHPVTWYASRTLRNLEEQCCDSRVIELLKGHERSYANALVSTVEYLSTCRSSTLPFPLTAIESMGSLTRRIKMLKKPKPGRLSLAGAVGTILLMTFPLLLAVAGDPSDSGAANEDIQNVAVVKGRVTDKAGQPLAASVVTVAIPAGDMRQLQPDQHRLLQAKTDANGEYELEIPGIVEPTKVSIDVASPGFRRSSGTLRSGGDYLSATVKANETVTVDASLQASRYYAGTVVDQDGVPLAGIEITATARTSRSSGNMEKTISDQDGRFEIFNYPIVQGKDSSLQSALMAVAGLAPKGCELERGEVFFTHPNYIDKTIPDVYAIAEGDERTLRIVMAAGRSVSGTVLDRAGNPAKDVMVKCIVKKPYARKAVVTDAEGNFAVRGLPIGKGTISCVDFENDQLDHQPLTESSDLTKVKLNLKAIELPAKMNIVDVLGAQLTDCTDEVAAAYRLWKTRGALVVSPGKYSEEVLGHGRGLKKGDCFWMVGDQRINNVSEAIDQLIAEAEKQSGDVRSVRVVFSFDRPYMQGSNTQHIPLTLDDIASLKAIVR